MTRYRDDFCTRLCTCDLGRDSRNVTEVEGRCQTSLSQLWKCSSEIKQWCRSRSTIPTSFFHGFAWTGLCRCQVCAFSSLSCFQVGFGTRRGRLTESFRAKSHCMRGINSPLSVFLSCFVPRFGQQCSEGVSAEPFWLQEHQKSSR